MSNSGFTNKSSKEIKGLSDYLNGSDAVSSAFIKRDISKILKRFGAVVSGWGLSEFCSDLLKPYEPTLIQSHTVKDGKKVSLNNYSVRYEDGVAKVFNYKKGDFDVVEKEIIDSYVGTEYDPNYTVENYEEKDFDPLYDFHWLRANEFTYRDLVKHNLYLDYLYNMPGRHLSFTIHVPIEKYTKFLKFFLVFMQQAHHEDFCLGDDNEYDICCCDTEVRFTPFAHRFTKFSAMYSRGMGFGHSVTVETDTDGVFRIYRIYPMATSPEEHFSKEMFSTHAVWWDGEGDKVHFIGPPSWGSDVHINPIYNHYLTFDPNMSSLAKSFKNYGDYNFIVSEDKFAITFTRSDFELTDNEKKLKQYSELVSESDHVYHHDDQFVPAQNSPYMEDYFEDILAQKLYKARKL